jgi:hypothetical protein
MVSHRRFCKTVGGGRLCEFASLSKNDTIVWVNEDFGFKRTVRTKVTFVKSTPTAQYCKPRGWTRPPCTWVNTISIKAQNAALMNAWSKNTVYLGWHRSNVPRIPRGQMTSRWPPGVTCIEVFFDALLRKSYHS